MPIDAVFLESLCEELQEKLLACRVDKVQQPERDTILLSMRGASGGGKLLLTASPNHPRIQLTNLSFENPDVLHAAAKAFNGRTFGLHHAAAHGAPRRADV